MFKTTSPYKVCKCSKCSGDAEYICLTCSCKMCVKCEQYHVNDIRSTGHNVVIISEKEYEGKEDIHSKYIDENATIKRQQYREIIHTIRSDTILRRRFILKEIKNDINTCHTQTYDVQSEMQNVAQNMKDMLDNWIRKIDSPHRCLNKKKELERYFSVLQRFEQNDEHSYIRPVRFLSFIKKTGIQAVNFHITYHKRLHMTDSIKRKDLKKLLSGKINKKRVRSIGNECLFDLMQTPELQNSFLVGDPGFQCHHISVLTSDRFWVNNDTMLFLTNSEGDILFDVEDFHGGLRRSAFTGGVHTVNSKQELFYLNRRLDIKKLSNDMKTKTTYVKRTNFLQTPRCMYSSRRTGDLLVGTITGNVKRYNQSGELIQSIKDNAQGQNLYKEPIYLTENNNGDIVVSDLLNGVVVTDYHGRHRFSFSMHPNGRVIRPFGICTDELSHIIVYDNNNLTLLVIDKNGNFIRDLYIEAIEPQCFPEHVPHGIGMYRRDVTPLCLSYDVTTHRLWVGTCNANKLYIYQHITGPNAINEIDEWEDSEILKQKKALKARRIFKDEDILKKHLSISGYIHGTKNGLEVVKVFLRYDDKIAKLEIKDNILEGLKEEFIIIPKRIKKLKKKLTSITKKENSTPEVDVVEMNRVGNIISNRASYVYKNHSDVFGLRISNVRCVDGKFKQEPCIVIYCLDKSFIPSGENKLPETLEGYPCDIRENIIMFGGGPSIGSSIGIPYNGSWGSVGFLVKSNVPSLIPVSGFLTAAHVAIKELHKLHDEKALLSECKQRKRCEFAKQTHFIVQPAWPHSDGGKPVGEVVESFCGNYKPYGEGKYNPSFGMDAAFIKTYPPMPEDIYSNDDDDDDDDEDDDVGKERARKKKTGPKPSKLPTVKEDSIMEVMDENSLIYDRSTKVLKRGIATGETNGILISNTASIAVRSESNNEYVYQFDNCYEIRSSEQGKPFFKAGDSGSAVFVHEGDKLKPLGIAFAFDAIGTTCACRIDQIVQAFNLSIYQEEEDMDTQDD